jgi:8-oxo-dGTP pyrophosphatase MutT (NUDIX family)
MSSKWKLIDLSATPQELAARLQQRLAQPLPGSAAQRCMAPALAYGRHSGPAALDARPAAVLALLYRRESEWLVPAMQRAEGMKDHAGQVALPGGMVEPGESPSETALREFEEELGASREGIRLAGLLSPVYVFNSNFLIQPIVAVGADCPPFCLNPTEASALVEIPVRTLLDPACRGMLMVERGPLAFCAPTYEIGVFHVWGATSMILAELAAILAGE